MAFFIYSGKKLYRENVLAPSCLKVTFSPPINTSFGRGVGEGEGASLYLSLFIIGEFTSFIHGCSDGSRPYTHNASVMLGGIVFMGGGPELYIDQ
jgi:hypothetical protein